MQSRYLNPEIGQFINADGLLGEVGNIQTHNMYAYCANNPVMYTDISGEFAVALSFLIGLTLLEVIIISVATVITTVVIFEIMNDFYYTRKTMRYFGLLLSNTYSGIRDYVYNAKKSKKARSTDKPSYVNKGMISKSLSAQQNARIIMNNKWGPGNWNKGPGSDYNRIVKWITRGELLRNTVNFFNDENNTKNIFDYQIYRRYARWKSTN